MSKILKKFASRFKNSEKEKYSISEESAIDEICRLLSYYDIDMGRLEVTDDTEVQGESVLNSLIRYFRLGKLKIEQNEKNFFVVQTLESGTEIKYGEPTAQKKRVMDKCELKERNMRIQMFMGALGNIGIDGVDQLNTRDLAVLEVLGNIFFLA